MSEPPKIKSDPLYRLLREGRVPSFNEEKARGKTCDLTHCDFRGIDLRELDAAGLDLSHCYFRQTDLRGLDLSKARLEGASIHGARIAGSYFRRKFPRTRSSCRSCTAPACVIATKAEFLVQIDAGGNRGTTCSSSKRSSGRNGAWSAMTSNTYPKVRGISAK